MAVSKSILRANANYRRKNYDSLTIQLKKGQRDFYKHEANERGLSLAALFRISVEEYLKNNKPLPKSM